MFWYHLIFCPDASVNTEGAVNASEDVELRLAGVEHNGDGVNKFSTTDILEVQF